MCKLDSAVLLLIHQCIISFVIDTKAHWRARVASETLTGVTQLKIGDVCLFVCILCLDVRMSFCTLTLALLC